MHHNIFLPSPAKSLPVTFPTSPSFLKPRAGQLQDDVVTSRSGAQPRRRGRENPDSLPKANTDREKCPCWASGGLYGRTTLAGRFQTPLPFRPNRDPHSEKCKDLPADEPTKLHQQAKRPALTAMKLINSTQVLYQIPLHMGSSSLSTEVLYFYERNLAISLIDRPNIHVRTGTGQSTGHDSARRSSTTRRVVRPRSTRSATRTLQWIRLDSAIRRRKREHAPTTSQKVKNILLLCTAKLCNQAPVSLPAFGKPLRLITISATAVMGTIRERPAPTLSTDTAAARKDLRRQHVKDIADPIASRLKFPLL
nr:hypothetical protein Iba_chr13fCG2550 [Ipomoea batatas]